MLKFFPNISVTLEQIWVFKADIIAKLTYSDLATKNMEDSARVGHFQGQSASS